MNSNRRPLLRVRQLHIRLTRQEPLRVHRAGGHPADPFASVRHKSYIAHSFKKPVKERPRSRGLESQTSQPRAHYSPVTRPKPSVF